jgi:hypothetical protein
MPLSGEYSAPLLISGNSAVLREPLEIFVDVAFPGLMNAETLHIELAG